MFNSASDPLGTNTERSFELHKLNVATNAPTQLTSNRTGGAVLATIDDASRVVVFHSAHLVLFPSQNLDGNVEIWKISPTGTGLTALTKRLRR